MVLKRHGFVITVFITICLYSWGLRAEPITGQQTFINPLRGDPTNLNQAKLAEAEAKKLKKTAQAMEKKGQYDQAGKFYNLEADKRSEAGIAHSQHAQTLKGKTGEADAKAAALRQTLKKNAAEEKTYQMNELNGAKRVKDIINKNPGALTSKDGRKYIGNMKHLAEVHRNSAQELRSAASAIRIRK
jgi:hypothetical protein